MTATAPGAPGRFDSGGLLRRWCCHGGLPGPKDLPALTGALRVDVTRRSEDRGGLLGVCPGEPKTAQRGGSCRPGLRNDGSLDIDGRGQRQQSDVTCAAAFRHGDTLTDRADEVTRVTCSAGQRAQAAGRVRRRSASSRRPKNSSASAARATSTAARTRSPRPSAYQDRPPIVGIGRAFDQSTLLESVHHLRRRPRRDPQRLATMALSRARRRSRSPAAPWPDAARGPASPCLSAHRRRSERLAWPRGRPVRPRPRSAPADRFRCHALLITPRDPFRLGNTPRHAPVILIVRLPH